MLELLIGVLFAVLFITGYLLIAKLLNRDKGELGGMRPFVTLNPIDTARAIGSGQAQRSLPVGQPDERNRHGSTSEDGPDRQREG